MSSTKVHNFSAGPCILPKEVFEKASQAVLDLEGSGLSILEMSHRSKPFEAVMAKAQGLVKELLGAPDNYEVVFLGGGASLGFHLIPLNYMRPNGKAAYANTGEWAGRAIKESARVGETLVVASSEDKNFSYIPKGFEIPNDADYFHFTSNNTIFGTQFKAFPKSPVPMICDMSSDIFSRPVNVKDFALIYGGAQKNMGPAGATVYLMDPERLGKSDRKISPVLDLKNHAAKGSMYNTPPVYAVYVSMLTLQWMKDQGGVVEMERRNAAKAKLLYDAVDRLPLFQGTTAVEDRSVMNPTFVMKDAALEPAFDELWKAAGINGIRGHRSVGGYRASMYNALPIESVQVLVDVMDEFAKREDKMRVHANDGISAQAKQSLQEEGFKVTTDHVPQDKLNAYLNDEAVDVLLVRSATKVRRELIDACPTVKLIGRGGVGLDNIDVAYAKGKGIPVINTPASSSISVAELVMAHLFSLMRNLHKANRRMPSEGHSKFKELKKEYEKGAELRGKTLGVIGFGRIGQWTARYALGCGMRVIYVDSNSTVEALEMEIGGTAIRVPVKMVSLDELLKQSDAITLHVPAQKDGLPLIGVEELAKVKPGAVIVNTARGGSVDEEALLSALKEGRLRGAALDVFVNEPEPREDLLHEQSLCLSPHIGAATAEAQARVGDELADQIIAWRSSVSVG